MTNAEKSKTVVMLGGSRLQVPAIKAAWKLGFRVVCADYDPNAVGFAVADASSLTSTLDVDAVETLVRDEGADFVVTSTSDAPVRVAALVSERLVFLRAYRPLMPYARRRRTPCGRGLPHTTCRCLSLRFAIRPMSLRTLSSVLTTTASLSLRTRPPAAG